MNISLKKIFSFLIIPIILLTSILEAKADSTLVCVKLIEPRNGSIYTGNTISFIVDIIDKNIDVKAVKYYLKRPCVVMGQEWKRGDSYLGEVTTAPYQFIWDCTSFSDMTNLSFYAIVIDTKGNEFNTNMANHIVLDRHVEVSALTLKAPHVESIIICDGNLDEAFWEVSTIPVSFPNGNNHIDVSAGWDKKNLYIGIKVRDTQLFSCFDTSYTSEFLDSHPLYKIYYSDFLAVYIDPLNRKISLRDTTECEVRISPVGYVNWRTSYRKKMSKGIKIGYSRIFGTLNNADDVDSLWIVELALPWRIIGIDPKSDQVLGFDVYNVDREDTVFYRLNSLWSGGGVTSLKNPSEWANLQLLKKSARSYLFKYVAPILVIVAIFIVFPLITNRDVAILKLLNRYSSPFVISYKDYIIRKINEYLEDNFKDENFSLDLLSKRLRLSKGYLMKIYKAENKITIAKKVTQIRIERAKELMEKSTNNITGIAYEVGFNSPEVFIRNFKRIESITPSEYKKRRIKGQFHKLGLNN
jgi:AraC-like DNA-binding protein